MKIIKAEKQFRNGEKEKLIYIPDGLENDEIVEDIVVGWAEREPSGQNYGWEVYWDEVKDKKTIRKCIAQEIKEAQTQMRTLQDKLDELKRHKSKL